MDLDMGKTTQRIGESFNKEVKEIKKHTKKSIKNITDLIVRHEYWLDIKNDIINKLLEER